MGIVAGSVGGLGAAAHVAGAPSGNSHTVQPCSSSAPGYTASSPPRQAHVLLSGDPVTDAEAVDPPRRATPLADRRLRMASMSSPSVGSARDHQLDRHLLAGIQRGDVLGAACSAPRWNSITAPSMLTFRFEDGKPRAPRRPPSSRPALHALGRDPEQLGVLAGTDDEPAVVEADGDGVGIVVVVDANGVAAVRRGSRAGSGR